MTEYLRRIATNIALDIQRDLRELYHDSTIEPSSPHYRFANLCDVASRMIIDRLRTVSGYGRSFTADTVHGEQRHSTRIGSSLWRIEHTWVRIDIFNGDRSTIYVDATCDQFHDLYPEIPPFYVDTEPPGWFLPDRDNVYFNWPRSNRILRFTQRLVGIVEYDLLGRLSDIVHDLPEYE